MLGLVWFGDALIYVVLPLHAEAFGLGLGMVGVALSLNRIVRIVGYGWVAVLHRRLGLRALTASAALGAALSTVGYGLALGLVPLLIARLMWGFAYGVLNVTTTAYAIGDGQGTGRRVGLNRAVGTVGPALALSGGAWLAGVVGPRDVFLDPRRAGAAGGAAGPDAAARGGRRLRAGPPGGDALAPVRAERPVLHDLGRRRRLRHDALAALRGLARRGLRSAGGRAAAGAAARGRRGALARRRADDRPARRRPPARAVRDDRDRGPDRARPGHRLPGRDRHHRGAGLPVERRARCWPPGSARAAPWSGWPPSRRGSIRASRSARWSAASSSRAWACRCCTPRWPSVIAGALAGYRLAGRRVYGVRGVDAHPGGS